MLSLQRGYYCYFAEVVFGVLLFDSTFYCTKKLPLEEEVLFLRWAYHLYAFVAFGAFVEFEVDGFVLGVVFEHGKYSDVGDVVFSGLGTVGVESNLCILVDLGFVF
jgi:hypothetical protein